LIVHSPEDQDSYVSIRYVEFFNVGKAGKKGSYPIHLMGNSFMKNSVIEYNSIHQSFNRGIGLNGVKDVSVF